MEHYPDTTDSPKDSSENHSANKSKKSLSMHEDVPVWCDCCSCEAEPYWLEAMEAGEYNEWSAKIEN